MRLNSGAEASIDSVMVSTIDSGHLSVEVGVDGAAATVLDGRGEAADLPGGNDAGCVGQQGGAPPSSQRELGVQPNLNTAIGKHL